MTMIDSKQKCYLCWLFFLCSTSTCWDFSGLRGGFSCLLYPLSPKGKVVALNNELHMTPHFYRQFRPLFQFQINIPKCLFFISTSTFHRHFTFGVYGIESKKLLIVSHIYVHQDKKIASSWRHYTKILLIVRHHNFRDVKVGLKIMWCIRIASRRTKYLEVNLPKEVQNLHSEH